MRGGGLRREEDNPPTYAAILEEVSERSLADALDVLFRAVQGMSGGDLQEAHRAIESWAWSCGAHVDHNGRSITIRFRQSDAQVMMLLSSTALSDHQAGSEPGTTVPDQEAAAALAAALNDGALRREIDEAVGPEPDLAV